MIVQLSNDNQSLADLLWSSVSKQIDGKAFSVENSTEKERVCRNKINHHQEMILWYIAMVCILVDVV